ncbi:methionine ABC transporter ATP-binding protein [Alkalicoccobacillus murimartini]|uniref:D-methionine transport system ATP-binding protein n=1 Tax=Alkalicoccobacillus murimartini TaxID=171685 RepID=A0ABT9YFL7_9BACI|nr:methionine ABC transporter ATP-binding protein [Alkalicoccobacillus murimartini]MDQ0206646.1 D-methionine transport system ATP-binding protein [Alkalicoccobacillus murimartini]
MITLKSLRKVFELKSGNVTAVDDVNLTIDRGGIFGIIGYSGAGKSTLIRMLNMLERPTEGEVEIDGQNLAKFTNKELRKSRQEMGMIFQHFNLLWSRTVYDNIAFPLEIAGVKGEKRHERVKELIQLVGLEGRDKSYPSQLSGGQKQRVGIARALANNPKVLLCDEATSALDPKTTDSILDLLVDINKKLKLTIVLITHEMHVIRKICTEVAVMDNGRVVEKGRVLDVFRHPKEQMTKEFLKQITEQDDTDETIQELLNDAGSGDIIQLTFSGTSAERPLISELIRTFQIDVSILHGKITKVQGGSYGTLFIQITGDQSEKKKALEFIMTKEVEAEVLSRD